MQTIFKLEQDLFHTKIQNHNVAKQRTYEPRPYSYNAGRTGKERRLNAYHSSGNDKLVASIQGLQF